MAIELKIPSVGESITEVMVGEWLISEGEWVDEDEPVAIIETDKVNVELTAPEPGVLKEILKQEGDDAEVGEVVGYLEAQEKPEGEEKEKSKKSEKKSDESDKSDEPDKSDKSDKSDESDESDKSDKPKKKKEDKEGERVMPAARRLLEEKDLEPSEVEATGPGGRLLKEDVIRHLDRRGKREEEKGEEKEEKKERREKKPERQEEREEPAPKVTGPRQEEAVKMTPLRRRVAERLVEAQQNAALLTTFNEIDMSRVIALRKQYQDEFRDKYGIKLGFMSFFVKASVEALKEVPRVNAEIRGEEIIYRNYQDVGIAVGGGKGLVVPVIRNAERLSFAEIEKTIADYAQRAQDGKLKLEELQGGTFTISNGGIYGSLLSTPIINPPQSGILGMHKFQDRPVAVDGEVVIRPMMYVALTYDHRLVDGREAVTFLLHVKERIEDPTRILLEV